MKKVLSLALALLMVLSCMSFAGAEGKGVINLYAFTDEVPTMLQKYIDTHPEFGYTLNTTIIATTSAYHDALLSLSQL